MTHASSVQAFVAQESLEILSSPYSTLAQARRDVCGHPIGKNWDSLFQSEYDFLHISPEIRVKDTLVDFLYHLRTTYDPHRVGLLNLAVDINGLHSNDLFQLEPSALDPRARASFTESLAQIREVPFMCEQAIGRQVRKAWGFPPHEPFFNRSFPIQGTAQTFERLHRDPRPTAQDLRRMAHTRSHPREMLHLWQQLLNKFDVVPPQIEYLFCLSFIPTGLRNRIYDHQSAENWLQLEDDAWTRQNADPARDQGGGNKSDRKFLF